MEQITEKAIRDGQKAYSRFSLFVYNLYVIHFSNRFVWRCPSRHIQQFYHTHLSATHCDVGVGTGYFLNHACFPVHQPDLTLLDINADCLAHTSRILSRYQPKVCQADLFKPLPQMDVQFKSIGLNYVLHCLPGSFSEKGVVIEHLSELLAPEGVLFGSTILAKDQRFNRLGQKLIQLYNHKGIFSNLSDDRLGLQQMLENYFQQVEIFMVGHVAFFVCRKS